MENKEKSLWSRSGVIKYSVLCLFPILFSTNVTFAAPVTGGGEVIQTQNKRTVEGKVVDTAGDPVIGAGVMVKGTSRGTVTEVDGSFSLPVSQGEILEITFYGLQTQEIVVGSANYINVVMQEDHEILDEVVVVGYGTQKKVNVTGAVSMVGDEVVDSRPVANITTALQGAIPGLNISTTANGGDIGTSMSINIRGTGSLSSSDDPLILIDGIEGDLDLINPNDIESVSVLKDASSSSVYGSRAAFGVILVTTKSGKSGRAKITYSGDVRFSTATQLPNTTNSLEWATYFNVANTNAGSGNYFSDETMERIKNYLAGMYTDPSTPEYYGTIEQDGKWVEYGSSFANTNWFKEFYKTNVPSTQHNISIRGGTDKINYSVSGSYMKQQGLIRHGHDELDRYTLNAKIGAQATDWLRIDYNSKWSRTDYTKPYAMQAVFFHNIVRRWPTCFPVDPNGHWADGMEIAELEDGGTVTTHNDQIVQQVKFTFEFIKDWKIYAEGSIRTDNYKQNQFAQPVLSYYADGTSWVRSSDNLPAFTYVYDYRSRQNYYVVNIYTDYVKTFNQVHNFKFMLGLNYERNEEDYAYASGRDLTNTDYPYLSQTQQNYSYGDYYGHYAVGGYFGRINYDYNGKYLAEFNLRYDASSRFVGDKRWAWFPSASVGWNAAKEDFFTDWTDKFSMLKLRVSWGELGNTNTSSYYPFYQTQSIGQASSSWLIEGAQQNVAAMPGIVSSLLTWETVETWDVGLDWAVFNNRLTGGFDWFYRYTHNMVGPAPELGSALGTSAPQVNNCDMKSVGWELEVSWRDHIGPVNYGIRANIADAVQTVTKYPNTSGSISSYYAGQKLGQIWGYTTHGIAQTDEEMQEWLAAGNTPTWGSGWGAGDIMYEDLDGDGEVSTGKSTLEDHGDYNIIGNSTPRYRFGVNIDLSWKNWDFAVFFQGVAKRDWVASSGDAYFWGATGNVWQSTVFKEHLDYWTEDNTDAYYPKPYFGSITKNQQPQTRYLQSAAYMRCKNIQLGYTLPQKISQKAKIENFRIYASCENLFTLTGLSSIYDPEALDGYSSAGWGSGKTYPLQRTWSIGLSVTF